MQEFDYRLMRNENEDQNRQKEMSKIMSLIIVINLTRQHIAICEELMFLDIHLLGHDNG